MSRDAEKDDELDPTASHASADSLLRDAAWVPDEAPLPQPGQVIGEKYLIEARIGRGGMGAVFRARHRVSQKPVALKWMLRPSSDEHARRRFLREARVAGRIDHPNVVNVYDLGEDGDCAYLVMELLHGEALRARLERGPLALIEALELLLPAMRGVAAVHQVGIVHRDLKPDNIFLCTAMDGTPREAKVLDFGISAVTTPDPTDPTLTKDGVLIGTPAYMSPEQLQSRRDVDARSDVYAFGVILYEALSGKLPFEADSYPGLVLAIVNAPPRPLIELRPELPAAIEGVVLRAMAKRPEERFANMDGLIAALTPFASARATDSAANVPAARQLKQNARRGRGWLLAGVALIVLGGSLWLLAGGDAGRDRGQRSTPTATAATRPPASTVSASPQAPASAPSAAAQAPAPSLPPAALPAAAARGPETNPSSERAAKNGVAPKPRIKRRDPTQSEDEPRSGRIKFDDL
jgi:serine/threonine-protein kinase